MSLKIRWSVESTITGKRQSEEITLHEYDDFRKVVRDLDDVIYKHEQLAEQAQTAASEAVVS